MWNFMQYSSNTAIITDDGCTLTYRQLYSLQDGFFNMLERNTLLLLVCTNTLPSLTAYLCCIEHGIPVMLEDNGIRMENLLSLMEQFEPEYLYLPSCYVCGKNADMLYLNHYKQTYKYGDYIFLKKAGQGSTEIHRDLALLLSTSGSTGSPKHVRISRKNLLCNTETIVNYLDIRSSDCTITSMPMSYSYGLSIINTYLYVGASIVLTEENVYSPTFWKLAVKYRITSFSGVPAVYRLFRRMNIECMQLSSLRVMTQAGGGMDRELWEYMHQYANIHGIHFFVMYGQTEATARISYLSPEQMGRKCGSIGKVIPGGRLFLTDESGEEIIRPYVEGEIGYEGINVSMGYALKREDLSMGNEENRQLHTGDYGYFDAEGYWYVTRRKDRFAKIHGKRLNLDEIGKKLEEKYQRSYFCIQDGEKIMIQGECGSGEILQYASEITGISRFLFTFEEKEQRRKL